MRRVRDRKRAHFLGGVARLQSHARQQRAHVDARRDGGVASRKRHDGKRDAGEQVRASVLGEQLLCLLRARRGAGFVRGLGRRDLQQPCFEAIFFGRAAQSVVVGGVGGAVGGSGGLAALVGRRGAEAVRREPAALMLREDEAVVVRDWGVMGSLGRKVSD